MIRYCVKWLLETHKSENYIKQNQSIGNDIIDLIHITRSFFANLLFYMHFVQIVNATHNLANHLV